MTPTHPAVVDLWDAGYPRVSSDLQLERDALPNQVQALQAHGLAAARPAPRAPGRTEGLVAGLVPLPDLVREPSNRPDARRRRTAAPGVEAAGEQWVPRGCVHAQESAAVPGGGVSTDSTEAQAETRTGRRSEVVVQPCGRR